MRRVIGAIGNRTHCRKCHAIVRAGLGHRSTLHVQCQRQISVGLHITQQPGHLLRAIDKAVTTGNEPLVQRHGTPGIGARRQRLRTCLVHLRAEVRIRRKNSLSREWYLIARKQRCGIHVVLQIALTDDHVAHLHTGPYPTSDTRKDNRPGREAFNQRCGRGRRRYLADTRQGNHYRTTTQATLPELATGVLGTHRRFKRRHQALLLVFERTQNRNNRCHGDGCSIAQGAAQHFADRRFGQL